METEDRKAIDSLFQKLGAVEQGSPYRDPAAEAFIQERIQNQPGAPYYMAQTIVVQEQSLMQANQRITQLEQQLAQLQATVDAQSQYQAQAAQAPRRSGGLFGGLFGGSAPAPAQPAMQPVPQPAHRSAGHNPWGQPAAGASPFGGQTQAPTQRAGGGFLAGAAQTAVGVAGGMMLGSALGSLFSGDEAHAAEVPETPQAADTPAPEEAVADTGEEEGGFFDSFGEDW